MSSSPSAVAPGPGAEVPPELFPNIIRYISREHQLQKCSLVCSDWRDIAQGQLFQELSVKGVYRCQAWSERLITSSRIASMVRFVAFTPWFDDDPDPCCLCSTHESDEGEEVYTEDSLEQLLLTASPEPLFLPQPTELRSLSLRNLNKNVSALVDIIRRSPLFHSFLFDNIIWDWAAVSSNRTSPGGSTRASVEILKLRKPCSNTIELLLSQLLDLGALREVEFEWWELYSGPMLYDESHRLAAKKLLHAISSSKKLSASTLVDKVAETDSAKMILQVIPGFTALPTILNLRAPLLESITIQLIVTVHATEEMLSGLTWNEVDKALIRGRLFPSLSRVTIAFELVLHKLPAEKVSYETSPSRWVYLESYRKDNLSEDEENIEAILRFFLPRLDTCGLLHFVYTEPERDYYYDSDDQVSVSGLMEEGVELSGEDSDLDSEQKIDNEDG
ncbi:hypothetical protein C8J56DRAFT_1046111 [Mycena floridula]|nr:hypothetical protein C8J56DRAFT_1046111 [Mycena floridula]